MDKIYKQAKDEHVAGVVVYADEYHMPGDIPAFVAYKDFDCTKRFTIDELKDAFIKGCIIMVVLANAEMYFKPSEFMIADDMAQFMGGEGWGIPAARITAYFDNTNTEDGLKAEPLHVLTWEGEWNFD